MSGHPFILLFAIALLGLVAVVALISGRVAKPRPRTAGEVAEEIERFLSGGDGPYDWDDFMSVPIADPELDAIRIRCAGLREEFPPDHDAEYCGEGGRAVLREYVDRLRGRAA